MRVLVALLALLAVSQVANGADTINDHCMKATGAAQCAQKAVTSFNCAFYQGKCVWDPCNSADTNSSQCLDWASTSRRCLWLPAAAEYKCVSYHFLCNRIQIKNCLTAGFCAVKSDSYCGYAIPEGVGSTGDSTAECTAFPLWSIALLVLWLFIMLILIAIIVLAMKRKSSSIDGVETSTVDVDNVAVRDDHFMPSPGLQEPINRNV